ncbi:cryptochrome/photolyase family protein [Gordonia crocea]|uniref:Deoxyribodipyrimidine photo-lyase n=1 Tax=Gordonia crocea TaxID=589162 RepID=A0A7M3SUH3_9ACTN|nr:deoxyribodipyrimidine photo-lyase [Gordonia crocea]GED96297.1 deoxyribodipyrimidine photo-lyase [Gordonia crocea]
MNAPAILWFRRDLRLSDLPALVAAAADHDSALAVFVLDPTLTGPSGARRRAFLAGCLRALDAELGCRLFVVEGDPVIEIPRLVAQIGADEVHVSADFGPYGSSRDEAVSSALAAASPSTALVRTGSPYAVSPGRILTSAGTPYKVFTPFRNAWLDHGWRAPADSGPRSVEWLDPSGVPGRLTVDEVAHRLTIDEVAHHLTVDVTGLPDAGEAAALRQWQRFLGEDLDGYSDERNRPDLDSTSRLSPYLKFGCLHPRTLLHDLRSRSDPDAQTLRNQLAWRDFYADVLHARPDTARGNYNPKFDAMVYNSGPDAESAFRAWCSGTTGFPIVDAGMRQLLAQGWMHNRVRMIVASFLTKDLHLPWWRGARHFMAHLVDGDLASNQHGWQWTAGCGTDAAPYFRVFNPVTQGEKFDPVGNYVRRWVPELRGIAGKAVHQPWRLRADDLFADPAAAAYPDPIVDHREEREVALTRYAQL